jgi:hypothetical protein
VFQIRIRIQEGKNYPQKSEEISCFEVLDVLVIKAFDPDPDPMNLDLKHWLW